VAFQSFEFFPKSFPPTGQVRDIKGDQICLKDDACYSHEDRVHCFRMKNITLSADEQLIEQARLLAKSRHRTLNAMFREWLEQFTARSGGTQEFDALMKRLKHVQAGRRFSRDEMNER
jgi:predicted transcriptional regulator